MMEIELQVPLKEVNVAFKRVEDLIKRIIDLQDKMDTLFAKAGKNMSSSANQMSSAAQTVKNASQAVNNASSSGGSSNSGGSGGGGAGHQSRIRAAGGSDMFYAISSILRGARAFTRGGRGVSPIFSKLAAAARVSPRIAQLMGMGGSGAGSGAGVAGAAAGAAEEGVAGAAAGAGGLAMGVSGVLIILALLAMGLKKAYEAIEEGRKQFVLYGGTTASNARAGMLSSWAGTGVGQIISGLQNNPVGAVMAGVNPVLGPYGDMDYAGAANKAMDRVRQAGSIQEARRIAALMGTPELANVYYLTSDRYNKAKGTEVSEEDQKEQANLSFDLQDWWSQVLKGIIEGFKPLLDLIARMAKHGNAMEKVIALFIQFSGPIMSMITLFDGLLKILDDVQTWLEDKFHIKLGPGDSDKDDHIKNLNDTLQDTNKTLKETNRVFRGAGARAAGTLPGRIRGMTLADQTQRAGLNLGVI